MKAMKPTTAAGKLIDQYTKWYTAGHLALVLGRAQQIAAERNARLLRTRHIRAAVKELAQEIEWKGEKDNDRREALD